MGNFCGSLAENQTAPCGKGQSFKGIDETNPIGQITPFRTAWLFTYAELEAATNNFSDDRLLGRGTFGKVYKGLLDEKGRPKGRSKISVAIKKLNSKSFKEFEEWQFEVNFLGSLSHPNLARLLGYCREGEMLFLVYEFMPRGSLKNHLFGRHPGVGRLPWEIRVKIAVGAAHGLSYLHELEKQTIYRDFRASYILLDQFYNAKISDFGLAKMSPTDCETYLTSRIRGEYGYAAPEYVATGHLSMKSDVHGFGIVLLEILTGQHVVDPGRPRGKENLLEWIKPYLCDGRMLKKIMDPCLEEKYQLKAALHIARLALACTAAEPTLRPSMKEVWNTLEHITAIKERPKKHTVHPAGKNRHA